MSVSGSLTQSDTFKWKIPQFLKKLDDGEILSQEFSVTDLDNKSGNCVLYIPKKESQGYVDIFLQNKGSTVLNLSYNISIEDKDGVRKKNCTGNKEFGIVENKSWLVYKFIALFELMLKSSKSLLPGGELTLVLEIEKPGIKSPTTCLSKNIEVLLHDTQFTDIKILCQGEVFPCHRNLLVTRSPVFKIMCTKEFKEGVTGEIKLNSMKPEIVKVMLLIVLILNVVVLVWEWQLYVKEVNIFFHLITCGNFSNKHYLLTF